MSMRPMIGGLIGAWLFLGTWCAPAIADGGALRLSETSGGYRISVFTAPTPFRAGPVDVSVLVQDASTGEPVTQVPVTIRMSRSGGPDLEYPATTEAATNKLFRAAQFDLPGAGRWALQVRVEGRQGPALIAGEVEAAEPLPRWPEIWPWFAWPALAIALFSVHQILVRRRTGRVDRGEAPEEAR
jgi:hypothetical protein